MLDLIIILAVAAAVAGIIRYAIVKHGSLDQ